MYEYPLKIQTYNSITNIWDIKEFSYKEDFLNYVELQFKEPGKYNLRNTNVWKTEYNKFVLKGYYNSSVRGTYEYKKYWKNEKDKSINGVEFDGIYVPGFYYFYLNFCPIEKKRNKRYEAPDVWDTDLHTYLYLTLAILKGKHVVITKTRQRGFEQPYSEPILSEYGWTPIGNLSVGDKVYTPKGDLTTITDIFEQGVKDVYEVKFMDGRTTKCGINHLWKVWDNNGRKTRLLTLQELINSDLFRYTQAPLSNGIKKEYKAYRYSVNEIDAIQFNEKNLKIPPYFLGALLGDGSISKTQLRLSSNDDEVFTYCQNELGDNYLFGESEKRSDDSLVQRRSLIYKDRFNEKNTDWINSKYGVNPMIRYITHYGLDHVNTYNKFIPNDYLFSSFEQRLELLKGLMDTDGYVNDQGYDIHYTTCSPKLASDILHLTRSLGLTSKMSYFTPTNQDHAPYYRLRIKIKDFNIFKLKRKADRVKLERPRHNKVPIVDIVKLDYQENSRCIAVDSEDKMYLTRDFIPTHNSLKLSAVLYWSFMWFERSINTLGASDEKFVKKTWRFLEGYRNFINKNTAWKRGPKEAKKLDWEEKQINTNDGSTVGLHSVLKGVSFKQSPSNDVGGKQDFFFYEEAGIAPTLLDTIGYIRNAIEDGDITTGTMIVSGSVGELDQCEHLKQLLRNPLSENFLEVPNTYNDPDFPEMMGLFIPDQWSLGGFIDEYGNSKVEEALEFIEKRDAIAKKNKNPEQYQLYKSQNPSTPSQAFNYRKESPFPQHLVTKQLSKILDGQYPCEYLDLYYNDKGKIECKRSNKLPIDEFPIKKTLEDKEGVIVVYERPPINPDWGIYYASIDPVGEGRTTTSNSLCSIIIYKRSIQSSKEKDDGTLEHFIEGDKIVAEWCGRFDDINKTHERLEMMIEWYNAWTLVEANVGLFFTHMTHKNKLRYLVPSDQMVFNREITNGFKPSHPYGWKNTGTIFKTHLLSAGIEFLSEELSYDLLPNGDKVNIRYGIERIPSKMLLKEMQAYYLGLNVDRLITYCSLIAFLKIQEASRGILRKRKPIEDTSNLYKINTSAFRSIGRNSYNKTNTGIKRQAFKNLK